MEKICKTCKKELNIEHFQKNGDFYRTECKECRNITIKRKWQENYELKKEYFKSLKTSCAKCNENRYYLIDFHHIDAEEKEICLSQIVKKTWSLKRTIKALEEESKKCICLCSNCHREFHHFEREEGITIEEYLR